MIENDHGHICSIASSAGYFAVPKLAEYCASKAAAAHFADVSFKIGKFLNRVPGIAYTV